MEFIIFLIIITAALLYEKIWRVKKCKKKIIEYIKNKEGEIISIEKISPRTEAYVVKYRLDGERKSENVKFSFFYDEVWY